MENLFSRDDLYLYRGVANFYKADYQAAVLDYKQSYKVKKMYKILDNELAGQGGKNLQESAEDSSDSLDTSDEDRKGLAGDQARD